MLAEDRDFFIRVTADETKDSVQRKLLDRGFEERYGMLHKQVSSFIRGFLNFYVVLEESNDIEAVYSELAQKLSGVAASDFSIGKNDCHLIVFFMDVKDETVLMNIRNLIESQRLLLRFKLHWCYAVLPIIYDKRNRAYILHKGKKASINPIDLMIHAFIRFSGFEKE